MKFSIGSIALNLMPTIYLALPDSSVAITTGNSYWLMEVLFNFYR
jgi:hypothetical protein